MSPLRSCKPMVRDSKPLPKMSREKRKLLERAPGDHAQSKQIVKPFKSVDVKSVFDAYPESARRRLLALRELIFRTAASAEGVGDIEETLKWGEPAYVTSQTRSGSTIRIAWKKAKPDHYAIYFNCQTTLVDMFRTRFPNDFAFEGNRAIVFAATDAVPMDSLAVCIKAALTYHRRKGGKVKHEP